MPIDLKAIIERGDATTNYQVMPGDRVIAYQDGPPIPADVSPDQLREEVKRQGERLDQMEQKLDLILRKLDGLQKP